MKNTMLSIAAVLALGLFAAFSLISRETPSAQTRPEDDFQKFLKQFPMAALPYVLSKEQMLEQLNAGIELEKAESRESEDVSYKPLDDPKRFIPSNRLDYISRVPVYKEPVARLATAQHHALIYSVSQGFSRPFKSYLVAVFDKNGSFLATHSLAGSGMSHLKTAEINSRLEGMVNTYKLRWENDIYETGLDENAISGLTLELSETIDLTKPAADELDDLKKKPLKKEKPVETIGALFN